MFAILAVLSIFAAVIPMVTVLIFIWIMDRYSREPLWLFTVVFVWGGTGAVILALFFNQFFDMALNPLAVWADSYLPGPWVQSGYGATVIAPLVEEPAKAAILLLVLALRKFDTPTDGLVYGAAAGLGFGMTENLLYFLMTAGTVDGWLMTVIIRTLFSAQMHATASALIGMSLAAGRFRWWPVATALFGVGLAVGMGMHALWNGLLSLEQINSTAGFAPPNLFYILDLVALPLQIIIALIILQVALFLESRTIRTELSEEAAGGILPAEHPRILSSYLLRHRLNWHPPGLDHRRYVEAATTLAIRRQQARLARGRHAEFYRDDVKRLRRQVTLLLESANVQVTPTS